ncbi:hypothetical protein ACN28G_17655 [Micromonospora sp. WMMA1923]|uniref:hypothetical protein n=1 Tax=Micromonospora sp. WMMA1923 TaxID=3404125 RepID=UPI003B9561DD
MDASGPSEPLKTAGLQLNRPASFLHAEAVVIRNNALVGWEEFLWHVDHRLGMYVGRPRYERAFSALTGFDLARGRGELAAFQGWMSSRHRGSSLAFWSLVLAETFGEGATEDSLTSDDDHTRAISSLCRLLREFLGQRVSIADQR